MRMPKIRYSNKGIYIDNSTEFNEFVNSHNIEVENKIVLLTKQNAEIIEDLIKKDGDCFPFSEILFEYYGKDKILNNREKSIFAIAREIDRDNSTNVWRYKTYRDSFNKMISFVANSENDFFGKF